MKIIHQGMNKEEALRIINNTRIFECSICGCAWEADETEYKYRYDQKEGDEWYECKCPNCEQLCRTSQAVGRQEEFRKWVENNVDKFERRNILTKRELEAVIKIPCDTCHDPHCEQCDYGYKTEDQIKEMLKLEALRGKR